MNAIFLKLRSRVAAEGSLRFKVFLASGGSAAEKGEAIAFGVFKRGGKAHAEIVSYAS